VSPDGTRLYVTWNGCVSLRDKGGRPTFDLCAMTVINLPEAYR
jgi:hypothetical protein